MNSEKRNMQLFTDNWLVLISCDGSHLFSILHEKQLASSLLMQLSLCPVMLIDGHFQSMAQFWSLFVSRKIESARFLFSKHLFQKSLFLSQLRSSVISQSLLMSYRIIRNLCGASSSADEMMSRTFRRLHMMKMHAIQ